MLRAILVSVDYADLLAITLPYNRHHFSEVMVVTSEIDTETPRIAEAYGAQVYRTNTFYEAGAVFNKWKALEEAFDTYGRHGWICNMDADVLWPTHAILPPLKPGFLYAPYRRMMGAFSGDIPPENKWLSYTRHRNIREWAGYSQIFHADDPVLGPPPWHQINWKHAGGADSFFQRKWPGNRKIRPDFEVLHLGAAGTNWCGRASAYVDGSKPAESDRRIQQLRTFMVGRRQRGRGHFEHEKY